MKKLACLVLVIATITIASPVLASEAKCREIARREYPSDMQMQNYVYNQQMSADRYMSTVTDQDVKQIALREYPEDYSMQNSVS